MFNVDGTAGQHREMTREALDVILRLWSEGEFEHKGKYWHVTKTGTMLDTLRPHIMPLQKPHPPIAVAGVSKGSDTLKLAGERGFWPMSLNLKPGVRREPLGVGGAGRRAHGAHAEARRLAPRARGLHRRHRRGSDAAFGGRHDGPHDEGVLPAAAGVVRLHGIPEAPAGRTRLGRDARVLRRHNWLVGSPAT